MLMLGQETSDGVAEIVPLIVSEGWEAPQLEAGKVRTCVAGDILFFYALTFHFPCP